MPPKTKKVEKPPPQSLNDKLLALAEELRRKAGPSYLSPPGMKILKMKK